MKFEIKMIGLEGLTCTDFFYSLSLVGAVSACFSAYPALQGNDLRIVSVIEVQD
ncbi:hypothetical protein [Arachidicoccus terrestris]|uniref:hypothetical protein n=1 Tax=Arachidicoccus terrestris TaxID=2875539 RepID=UPI001CC5C887|nr:hypothetical protein [Arachidicoccus terrestris]UAY54798.1 hypothetical protein K9M52_15320 [Arachidicoccus terrestris]